MKLSLLALTATLVLGVGAAQAQLFVPGHQPAGVPVEITAAPTRATSGTLSRGTVVAQRTIVVREAAVLLDPVKTVSRDIPAGTALARLDRLGSAEPAWCDMRKLSLFNSRGVDCLEDSDHDGRLDRVIYGHVLGLTPVSIDYVTRGEPLAASAAIRPARPDERPTAEIGYMYCKGDGATEPPRFAFAVKTGDRSFEANTLACPFGAWAQEGDKIAKVDAVALKVTPGDKPAFQLTQDYTAGPLGHVAPGESLVEAAKAATPAESTRAKLVELLQAPLKPVGPAEVHAGEAKTGDVILSIPVTNGITGRLTAPVKALGLFASKTPLPTGQGVFGVPMSDNTIVWCAPREETAKDGTRSYDTVCLPQAGATRWVSVGHTLFVRGLSFTGSTSFADAPNVERGPVDFDMPMTLVYRYGGVRAGKVEVQFEVQTPMGTYRLGWRPALPGPGGLGLLPALGGGLKITPAADGKTATVEVLKPIGTAGAIFL
jgi:hypothetical protein